MLNARGRSAAFEVFSRSNTSTSKPCGTYGYCDFFFKAKTLKRGLRLGFWGLVHGSGAFGSRPVLVLCFVQPFYWEFAVALRVKGCRPKVGPPISPTSHNVRRSLTERPKTRQRRLVDPACNRALSHRHRHTPVWNDCGNRWVGLSSHQAFLVSTGKESARLN